MAKYKLTVITTYEDNETAAESEYQQKYVDAIAEDSVGSWNTAEVRLEVNGKDNYHAEAKDGPTKREPFRGKADRWPWIKTSDMVPEKEGKVLVYLTDGENTYDIGNWHEAHFYKKEPYGKFPSRMYFSLLRQTIYEKDFDKIWWRTVELPEAIK